MPENDLSYGFVICVNLQIAIPNCQLGWTSAGFGFVAYFSHKVSFIKMQVLRRLVLLAFAIAVSACMPQKPFDPHDLPLPVPLQEPPTGKAVVYLLRAPHDDSTVVVYFDEKKIARLPPATYTVTVIDPGIYQVASSPSGRSDADPASSLTVKEGEIRFLYLSAATGSTAKFIAAPIRGAGFVPLLLPTYGASGAKTWKECTELDAQGFMSIAKPIAPEPGAA